jgi:hypothetical protein
MVRRFLVSSVVCLFLTARWGPAMAGLPDPQLSTIPNVLVSPAASLAYTVVIESVDGPVSGALVRLSFSGEADGLACWSVGQTRPDIDAITNAAGVAVFYIAGGGCLDPQSLSSPPVVEVSANGIKLAEVGVLSPDAVDGGGLYSWQGWDPDGVCRVGVGDAVSHTSAFAQGTYSFCSDANSDLIVTLGDAVIFTQAISTGEFAVQQP